MTESWSYELERQLLRGKHVILHGNVFDLTLLDNNFFEFDHVLALQLDRIGYKRRIRYDLSVGFDFSDEVVRRFFVDSMRFPGEAEVSSSCYYLPPADAFPELIKVLQSHSDSPLAVIIDFADRLFGSDESTASSDRILMVEIMRAFKSAYYFGDQNSPYCTMRNAVVLVGSHLGSIPAWLYRDNPLTQLVAVKRPDPNVRRKFIQQRFEGFYNPLPNDQEKIFEQWTMLTDGLRTRDLESIRLASFHEKISPGHCRELIDFFKHGKHKNSWEELKSEKLDEADRSLPKKIFGQSEAIKVVLNALRVARSGISLEGSSQRIDRPKGILFFVGPTGVGKTELAKQVTELVFGDSRAFARFDMSEYQAEHAAERLTGAPPSYVGFEQGGQLTGRMKDNPFSLLLFDEVDKAHVRVLDRFLQVLDDGRLTDGRGETVYFGQSIILFTCNIGSSNLAELGPNPTYEDLRKHFVKAVEDYFKTRGRPELLGRIGKENIVVFDILRRDSVGKIVGKFLNGIAESAQARYQVAVRFDQTVFDHVVRCCDSEAKELGARAIRDFVSSQVLPAVSFALLKSEPGQNFMVQVRNSSFVMERVDGCE